MMDWLARMVGQTGLLGDGAAIMPVTAPDEMADAPDEIMADVVLPPPLLPPDALFQAEPKRPEMPARNVRSSAEPAPALSPADQPGPPSAAPAHLELPQRAVPDAADPTAALVRAVFNWVAPNDAPAQPETSVLPDRPARNTDGVSAKGPRTETRPQILPPGGVVSAVPVTGTISAPRPADAPTSPLPLTTARLQDQPAVTTSQPQHHMVADNAAPTGAGVTLSIGTIQITLEAPTPTPQPLAKAPPRAPAPVPRMAPAPDTTRLARRLLR